MTLATHATIGTIIATKFPGHPVVGFFAAFVTHFILDTIPHWDYPLRSLQKDESNPLNNKMPIGNKNFITDLFHVGLDFCIGLVASLLLFLPFSDINLFKLTLIGVAGGVLPDFLQFVYMEIRKEPLILIQRFHVHIHTKNKMKNSAVLSIVSQVALVLIVFYIIR